MTIRNVVQSLSYEQYVSSHCVHVLLYNTIIDERVALHEFQVDGCPCPRLDLSAVVLPSRHPERITTPIRAPGTNLADEDERRTNDDDDDDGERRTNDDDEWQTWCGDDGEQLIGTEEAPPSCFHEQL